MDEGAFEKNEAPLAMRKVPIMLNKAHLVFSKASPAMNRIGQTLARRWAPLAWEGQPCNINTDSLSTWMQKGAAMCRQ